MICSTFGFTAQAVSLNEALRIQHAQRPERYPDIRHFVDQLLRKKDDRLFVSSILSQAKLPALASDQGINWLLDQVPLPDHPLPDSWSWLRPSD
ncbi:MAG: hypothetical protein Q8Q20_00600 [bacterium]|nr:hypothetical protein [bacterium]